MLQAMTGCMPVLSYKSVTTSGIVPIDTATTGKPYTIVDTGQSNCYDSSSAMETAPAASDAFYGQDAQYRGNQPDYTVSGDGKTVYDVNTGLTWMKGPNTGLGTPVKTDKMTYSEALAHVAAVNTAAYGGYGDWRLPSVKELYSLIDFRGMDPSGFSGYDTSSLTPFIDDGVFNFAYGQTSAGERVIDSQYLSSDVFADDPAASGYTKFFGVNFADGRIKGYDAMMPGGSEKTFFVQLVRGNTAYGTNDFTDNGDGTVTDNATGLMWSRTDSGSGMTWEAALAWVRAKNEANYLGHGDWRLPNAKELQSIVDYTHAPDSDGLPAINTAYFSCTAITNENYQTDYPWYWTGTTHATYAGSGGSAVYVAFGRAMGYTSGIGWNDIHGAGCQRSDPKSDSLSGYTKRDNGYYNSVSPQGDAVRVYNYVRLVRNPV